MFNFKTKNPYSGQNIDILMSAGFGSEYWMTFNQAREMGYMVQKGQKGTQLMKVVEKEEKDKKSGKIVKKKVPKYFYVFNMEQMEQVAK